MLQQKAFARVTAVVLASGSPRRRELLQHVLPDGINFVVQPSSFAEDLPKGDDPAEYCAQTAFCKGEDVAKLIGDEAQLIISADTVVVADGNALPRRGGRIVRGATDAGRRRRDAAPREGTAQVLEKPRDAAHATEMLRTLSGATHRVVTGCALFRGGRRKSFYETTEVTFSELSDETIAAYVASDEPYFGRADVPQTGRGDAVAAT